MTISKVCTEFLRNHHLSEYGQKLKATHAREIVAAFFGYKSHTGQLAEVDYPLEQIEQAAVMVPDVARIGWRLARLNGLPSNLPSAYELARILAEFLVEEGWFGGNVWLYETVENYVLEVYLPENDYNISEQLSGVMAETNAYFEEAYFDEAVVDRNDEGMTISSSGTYSGSSDQDRMFSGDTIDMNAIITLNRVAGHICFYEEDFSVGGEVNDDWYGPDEEPQVTAAE
ncbi:hypothetical protein KO498_04275 [Lentibacter algarum]|uniref:hypothetical protein n=1 Tax=Lentibacter algarum TaxID=576131 RepID=UPI001C07194F|nr:hypothetical protein [Lentibacter algarum]MBU2981024.1 hypothetical protein [Lentibacter algarum]